MKLCRAVLVLFVAFCCCSFLQAEGTAYRFLGSVHVAQNEEAEQIVCVFCSARIEGKVTGDVLSLFGSVDVKGDAQHDVVGFFSAVEVETGASVENNLIAVFSSLRVGEGVGVGRNLTSLFGSMQVPDSVTVGDSRFVEPLWLVLLPLFLVGGMIFLVVREYVTYQKRLKAQGYVHPKDR